MKHLLITIAVCLMLAACSSSQQLEWPLGSRPLKPGMRGNDVAQLHRELNRHGISSNVQISGSLIRYTSKTTKAVRQFQTKVGLPATGKADAATLVLIKAPQTAKLP